MTFVSQDVSLRHLAGSSEATGARSFTTRGSHKVCTEDRWKKFLSLISRADSASG
jgi:hypothetical protein